MFLYGGQMHLQRTSSKFWDHEWKPCQIQWLHFWIYGNNLGLAILQTRLFLSDDDDNKNDNDNKENK